MQFDCDDYPRNLGIKLGCYSIIAAWSWNGPAGECHPTLYGFRIGRRTYRSAILRVSYIRTLIRSLLSVIVIVIVISKLLKRYSKAKRTRAPAYSRALRRIKGGFPKGGQEKLRSYFQSTKRGQSSC